MDALDLQAGTSDGAITRRRVLAGGAGVLGAMLLPSGAWARRVAARRATVAPTSLQEASLRVLGRSELRLPGSLPDPSRPMGTDTMPEIEHVVVLMLENHSYDNFFGMLGRGAGERPRGEGFALAADGLPKASNPYADGTRQRAFHMPTTCQLGGKPSQEWTQSHIQYAEGRNNGFVISESGPVAMGYWTGADLPFTYALASRFPIGDHWFCSVLGQTDPQRRYLIAATSSGMTDDVGGSIGNLVPDALLGTPADGTIFDRMSLAGISWTDYNAEFPDRHDDGALPRRRQLVRRDQPEADRRILQRRESRRAARLQPVGPELLHPIPGESAERSRG